MTISLLYFYRVLDIAGSFSWPGGRGQGRGGEEGGRGGREDVEEGERWEGMRGG